MKTAEDYRNERKALLSKRAKLNPANLTIMEFIAKVNRIDDRLRRVEAEIKRRK